MPELPTQLVTEFFAEYSAGRYSREHIHLLTELAIDENDETAEVATRAFFELLIEPLADSFDPEKVSLYNRIFAQVIDICRRDARAATFDSMLREFDLESESDVQNRAETLRQVSRSAGVPPPSQTIKLVIVLSRITIGADVTITSVIIERLKREFPSASIVLLGGNKTRELFGGDPRIQVVPFSYGRSERLLSRLTVWTRLIDSISDLTKGVHQEELLIVDPDTRLTQLGLLPVSSELHHPNSQYLFFPSREYGSGTSRPLGQLTSDWLDDRLGKTDRIYPKIFLSREDLERADTVVRRLVRRRVIAVNFGVGDNAAKRVGAEFELKLIAGLIREGSAIILDKGAGDNEAKRIDSIVNNLPGLCGAEIRSCELCEADLNRDPAKHKDASLLIWNGRIGMLAALISQSDLYIGYDSAGQHIAAALGVPCIDVFAAQGSGTFVNRWTPAGKSIVKVLRAEGQSEDDLTDSTLKEALKLLDNASASPKQG